MRAAVMRKKELYVEDIAEPKAGPGQVLAEVIACGICGSDLHALQFTDKMVEAAKESGSSSSPTTRRGRTGAPR